MLSESLRLSSLEVGQMPKRRTWLQRLLFGDVAEDSETEEKRVRLMAALDDTSNEARLLREALQRMSSQGDPLSRLVENMRRAKTNCPRPEN